MLLSLNCCHIILRCSWILISSSNLIVLNSTSESTWEGFHSNMTEIEVLDLILKSWMILSAILVCPRKWAVYFLWVSSMCLHFRNKCHPRRPILPSSYVEIWIWVFWLLCKSKHFCIISNLLNMFAETFLQGERLRRAYWGATSYQRTACCQWHIL